MINDMKNLKMKHLFLYILTIIISSQSLSANGEADWIGDPPSYKAPNGKTYTWRDNFSDLSVDYTLAELVNMPVWICCGNTSFQKLPSEPCRKGILNSGIKPHEVLKLSSDKTYTNSLGQPFTPDQDRLRLFGFCIVEGDSRGLNQTVDINKVCDELKEQMIKEGKQPCEDLSPQNIYPDYEKQLIYYTVCGKTYSKPMDSSYQRPAVQKEEVIINCVDEFNNLPVVEICEGETYNWVIDDASYTYDKSGTYMHTVSKADDCGKMITILNLDFFEPIDTTLVPTQKYDFANGDVYSFQGMTLDSAGTYKKPYVDVNGCNAMATIVLQEEAKPQSICSDCVTNAKNLEDFEIAARLNYGSQPVHPDVNPINHLGFHPAFELGFWQDWQNKKDILNGNTCKNSLFEYGINGGIALDRLYGGESSECDCNDASEGSNIHLYLEPGVRWHYLGFCDISKLIPTPVLGAKLRMHYNDHKIEDITKITLSPKLFAEGRWYLSKALFSPKIAIDDSSDDFINSLFLAIGGEAIAPAFQVNALDYIGYLKLGYRF